MIQVAKHLAAMEVVQVAAVLNQVAAMLDQVLVEVDLEELEILELVLKAVMDLKELKLEKVLAKVNLEVKKAQVKAKVELKKKKLNVPLQQFGPLMQSKLATSHKTQMTIKVNPFSA